MELRTPLGCRDILSRDLRRRQALETRIQLIFDRFGFAPVATPAVEYYQIYNQAFSNLEDRSMLKLTDENMDLLAMRQDMTVPIARLAATTLKNAPLPLRLSYTSDVWKVRKAFSGKAAESTDCGVELIGSSDDREILVCALEAMKASGLKDWSLELSDARLVQNPAQKIFANPEDIARLCALIDEKSMVELEEFLAQFPLPETVRQYFLNLPLLDGDFSVLPAAIDLSFDPETAAILDELAQTALFLRELGYGEYIRFDLGKLPHIHYYTGLIFEAYVPGASSAVLSGGRYDDLMAVFNRPMPAVGFAIKVDPLCALLPQPQAQTQLKIVYPESKAQEAFEMAARLRQMQPVTLLQDNRLADLQVVQEVRP